MKFAGYGNVRSSGRVQTPTLAIIVERERERMAFVPEDYWVIRGAFDGAAAAGPTAGDGPEAFEAPHATARFKAEAEAAAAMAHVEGAVRVRQGGRNKKIALTHRRVKSEVEMKGASEKSKQSVILA